MKTPQVAALPGMTPLGINPTSSRNHSEKGLKTLAEMNTQPADWTYTPIKWVKEERTILIDGKKMTEETGLIETAGEVR